MKKGIKARVGNVNKGLMAVCEVVDAGGEVHFTKRRRWMKHNSTGEEIEITRRGKSYELDMKLLPYADVERMTTAAGARPFGRQAHP